MGSKKNAFGIKYVAFTLEMLCAADSWNDVLARWEMQGENKN